MFIKFSLSCLPPSRPLRGTSRPPMVRPAQQWPRGPRNKLHDASFQGSTARTLALLSRENQSTSSTTGIPKVDPAHVRVVREGHAGVAKILLKKRANVNVSAEDGTTALHAPLKMDIALTVDLIKAGGELDAKGPRRM